MAASATQMWVASSVCTKNAIVALSGDQVAFVTRPPCGIWIGFLDPSVAEISCSATLLRTVSARTRLALKSTNRPPSS